MLIAQPKPSEIVEQFLQAFANLRDCQVVTVETQGILEEAADSQVRVQERMAVLQATDKKIKDTGEKALAILTAPRPQVAVKVSSSEKNSCVKTWTFLALVVFVVLLLIIAILVIRLRFF